MHEESRKKIEAIEEKVALEKQKNKDRRKTTRRSFDELYETLVQDTNSTSAAADVESGGE